MALAKIVYASMTGNTEEIADIFAEQFETLDIEGEINDCTQVEEEELEERKI
ncbi:flavodoxin, partial [Enterococcus faecium]